MKKEIETYFYLDGLTIVVEDLKKENKELKDELIKTNEALIKLKKLSLTIFSVLFVLTIALVSVVFFI
jgi:hypothetical protein